MTDEIVGVLFEPAPKWREALLANGACGVRVPQRWREWHENYGLKGGKWGGTWVTFDDGWETPEHESAALVLVDAGTPVNAGCDQLARAMGRASYLLFDYGSVSNVVTMARQAEADGLGRPLFINADGREVSSG